MKFSAILAAGFAAVAYAVKITNGPADFVGLKVGSTFKITWSDAVGPVTLTLQHGDPNNLQTVQVISSGLSSGEFDWPIPNLPVDSAYAIRIDDSTGVPNWSVPFAITGGSGSFTSGTASGSTSASSTATGSTSAPSSTGSTTSSVSSATTSASTSESTTASSSSKTTSSSATTTAAKPTTTVPNNNDARRFSSPLALVLVTVAALVYFN